MEFDILVNGVEHRVSVQERGDDFDIQVDGKTMAIESVKAPGNLVSFSHEGDTHRIYIVDDDGKMHLQIHGEQYLAEDMSAAEVSAATGEQASPESELEIRAPMPGKILKISVSEGDRVSPKQPLLIVEAMKMENSIMSRGEGIVRKINFKEGDVVDTGQPIIELDPVE
jgi:biotin carboxyl carrier protein